MLQAKQLKLWEAAELGDAAEVARCLEAGASRSVSNRFGWNALHRACMSGSVECVGLLLPAEDDEAGRELALKTPDGAGNMPLHIAAGCGHRDVARQLLGAGAVVDAPTAEPKEGTSDQDTPMHTACKALSAAQGPLVEKLLDTIVELLSKGGLLESQDAKGKMAAMYLTQVKQRMLLARVKPPAPS